MRTIILCASAVLFSGFAAAQNDPPPIVRFYVEQVKPGKGAAHEKSETNFVRAMSKANFPAHYIALTAMAGADEVWFMEEHSSFAEVEKSDKVGEEQPLKGEMEPLSATDGEYISGVRTLIGVFRKDLSFLPEQAVANLPKTRYMDLITVRIKPGTEQKLTATVRDMFNIYRNAGIQQSSVVYQVISGAPGGTFLIFEPMASLAEWDKYPAMMKSLHDVGGRKFEITEQSFAEISAFEEGRLMSVSPKMSYVSKEFAAGDPDYWTPKPKPAVAKPAPKSAAKHTGQ